VRLTKRDTKVQILHPPQGLKMLFVTWFIVMLISAAVMSRLAIILTGSEEVSIAATLIIMGLSIYMFDSKTIRSWFGERK